jgi:transposase InsO family protein
MSAFAERFVLSVKSECLAKMILFGEASLRRALREFCTHYHRERPHQGIGNDPIRGEKPNGAGEVVVRHRLGGVLQHYRRVA